MELIDNNGVTKTLNVHPGGYIYYDGRQFDDNEIKSVSSDELAILSISKEPKTGRLYIRKGGQKRLYIDNAQITDLGNMLVKDYFNQNYQYDVTITLKMTVNGPTPRFAEKAAMDALRTGKFPLNAATTCIARQKP